jgi:hypothetical protein
LRLFSARRQDDEFVATDRRDKVAAGSLFQPARNGTKKFVANDVAEHVVSLLEIVEIDAEHGKAVARELGLFEGARELGTERRPVG